MGKKTAYFVRGSFLSRQPVVLPDAANLLDHFADQFAIALDGFVLESVDGEVDNDREERECEVDARRRKFVSSRKRPICAIDGDRSQGDV